METHFFACFEMFQSPELTSLTPERVKKTREGGLKAAATLNGTEGSFFCLLVLFHHREELQRV